MSVRKLTLGLLAMVALTCGMQTASAQDGEHVPFADPLAFDPDFRWFEPVSNQDLMDMRPSKRAATGWFGTLDRMNLFVTRPEDSTTYFRLDDGWGGRGEIGFMTDKDHGWMATLSNLNGPNASNIVAVERINRLNSLDLVTSEDGPEFTDARGQLVPASDRNTAGQSGRFYYPGESLNQLEMDSFEINKTFRMEPYHYGGILEPMIGFRYMHIEDRFFRSQYRSTETLTYPVIISPTDDPTEQFITDSSNAGNQMFGGQLGFRYFKFYDRFMLSTDMRVFAMQNFQQNENQSVTRTTVYDGTGIDAETILYETLESARTVARADEFAFGFDLRSELAYTVTRDFSIRGGLQIYDVAQGVWRGRIDDANDQALFMVGYTFGITLNR